MNKKITTSRCREYLTNFYKRRSIIALCSGLFTLILSFYAIIAGVIRTVETLGINGFSSFFYFTMISNTLAAFSVAFVIPFAVDGIKRKNFVLPKWVAEFNYISATSITIMLVFVLFFMSWASPYDAFGGSINIILHVFCPTFILLSFFQIENKYIYSIKDCFIGCLPFFIYIIIYFIEVVLIGEENGGWKDLYRIQEFTSPLLAIPLLLLFGFFISWLIAMISNYLTKKREERMFLNWKKDINPLEAKIEAYGLGNMIGQKINEDNMLIPLDILDYLAQKSNTKTEDLIKSYIVGLTNIQSK